MTPSSPPRSKPLSEVAASLNVNPEHTFEALKVVTGLRDAVLSFRGVLKGPRFTLMVYGGVGNGKTHMLEASSIELYRQGKFARVMVYTRMLSTLKSAISNPDMDYQDILNNYCYAERLIIDDIGAGESDTDFGDKILEAIVCARHGRELLTIMSTNRDIDLLPERVLSRLKDKSTSYLVLNKAPDYRPQKARGVGLL